MSLLAVEKLKVEYAGRKRLKDVQQGWRGRVLSGLSGRRYSELVVALEDVSLRLDEGQIWCVLGPSGCGKTTLLRGVAGVIPAWEGRVSGRVLCDGADVTTVSPQNRRMSMVAQSLNLLPFYSVYQNLEFPLRMNRIPTRRRRIRVLEIASLLGIEHLLYRRPAELSGGEQQRVALGRALVRPDAKVQLYDEPFGSLDMVLRTRLRRELRSIHDTLRNGALLVTHDPSDLPDLADAVLILKDGRVLQSGSLETVTREPADIFVLKLLTGDKLNSVPVSVTPVEGQLSLVLREGSSPQVQALPEGSRLPTGDGATLAFSWTAASICGSQALDASSARIRLNGIVGSRRPLPEGTRVTVACGASQVTLDLATDTHVTVGQAVALCIPLRSCFIFMKEGARVRP